ncbi:hypothetical protein BRC70_03345 [Halobacteriales archaeon QH_6_68_27]|nr:MAG: hypothetical protein BRC70_03345 [Halobacteriales archaeon QH_6_68_27]
MLFHVPAGPPTSDTAGLPGSRLPAGIRAGVADRDSDAVETAIRRLAAAPVTVALEDAGAERVLSRGLAFDNQPLAPDRPELREQSVTPTATIRS